MRAHAMQGGSDQGKQHTAKDGGKRVERDCASNEGTASIQLGTCR